MMRKLLLFLAMFCVSIGTWATTTIDRTTWCQYNSYADQENVLTIYVSEPGELATAIAGQDFTNVQILHISAGNRTASLLQLTDEDKAALASVNVKTIEMMRAYVEPFTLTNSNVERIILPYNWTKEQVKAVGQANSTSLNFEACISMNDQDKYDNREGDAALIAYLNKPNTLKDAIMRTWNDTHGYAPLGNQVYQGGGDCSRLKYLTVMGNICARDISKQGFYDANGHYETRGIPDENSQSFNTNTAGETYYVGVAKDGQSVSGAAPGALAANTGDLYYLDLRDAYVPDEYADDIVFPYSQMGGSNLKEIWMPQDSRFKTVPADYLNTSCNVRQICIPGNIEYIKTRAFAGKSGTGRLNYIWTTGPDANVKYDNGAAFESSGETTWKYMNNTAEGNVAMTESDYNKFAYGTFTLPANLRLIERFAFSGSDCVSDVYVLNTVAPECHVDAFNCVMYVGNNSLQSGYIKDGIITREAYRVGTNNFVSILHYPRETTDPNIQRYTDPTREYSIATGERDGNGSTIYFPNHSEMTYAYYQGSYGYLWKGWDDSRNWYDQSLKAGYGQGLPSTDPSHQPLVGDNTQYQDVANQRWVANTVNLPKADRSFYDVTTGQNNQFGEVTAPTGLTPYYQNQYAGMYLYPQAKSETSNFVYVRDDNGDYVKDPSSASTTIFRAYAGSADDQLERYSRKQDIGYYSCSDGRFVQDYTWTKDEAGRYILDGEYTLNTTGGGAYVLDYTWGRDDANGTHYHPLVSTAFPGDEHGNLPNDFNAYADYWYATFSYNLDPNGEGEYVKAYDNNYYTQETLPSYWANDYQTFKNNGTYNRTPLGYDQCANNEDVKNHKYDLFVVGDTYALWTSDVIDFVNGEKFVRIPIEGEYREYNSSTDEGCDRYDITGNGFVLAVSPADDSKQHYTKSYVANSYREFDSSRDKTDEPLYCYGESDYFSDTPITYTVQNDYRGWHQFILGARGYNYTDPMEPLRSFISDNDWWTICEPYDLRYSDLIKFFGTDRLGFEKKIPYLSKLMYVVRDVENQKITLMFSKNLMKYKEQFLDANTQQGKETAKRVHGLVNDQVEWTPEELEQDPIILHAGVPYLIKPDMMVDNTTGKYKRQFDIFKSATSDLYERLHKSEELSGTEQMDLVYAGEYTVPAYVVGYGAVDAANEGLDEDGELVITMKDGTTITYQDSKKDAANKITYKGKEVSYRISNDFKYTFVGSFYKSVMPQYCYFLGWDSKANRAAFWYSAVQDKSGWNWNNETGIICPNFDTDTEIHKATEVADPARWTITNADGVSALSSDDFPGGTGVGGAKSYTMDFGATNYFEWDEATGVSEMVVKPMFEETKVYDANGRYMGSSLQNLPKGVYIVNGKKYVVK